MLYQAWVGPCIPHFVKTIIAPYIFGDRSLACIVSSSNQKKGIEQQSLVREGFFLGICPKLWVGAKWGVGQGGWG